MRKTAIAMAMGVAHLLLPATAMAGGGGFAGATEMTQMANNVELAMVNVEESMQTVQDEFRNIQLIEQTYYEKLQQLQESIGQYTAPFQKAYDTYKTVVETKNKLVNLQNKLVSYKGMLEGRILDFGASKLDWGSYMSREHDRILAGDQMAKAKYASNMKVLEETQGSLQAYQDSAAQMAETVGTHGATQVLGAQLSMVGSDLNKLIYITAERNAAQAAHEAAAVQEKSVNAMKVDAMRRDFQASKQKDADLWGTYKAPAK